MSEVTENTRCLACGSEDINLALDLGQQPLANSYKNEISSDQSYPLAVNVCDNCYHVQLTHTVSPEIIYKNYLYVAGTSNTLKVYSEWFANFCKEYTNNTAKTVLDIGCNDGTQLNYFKQIGLETYGIDPAENIHATRNQDHTVICDFFGPGAIDSLKQHSYDIISAQNVFAHNPDPLKFLQSCKDVMHDNTLLFIQTSQANMILNNEFDTIYHEHVNFFNADSMRKCADRAGLNLIDVLKTPIHGTSYVFVLSKKQQRPHNVSNILTLEAQSGLYNINTYTNWEKTVRNNLNDLIAVINHHREDYYVLAGYGAAAKGMTLLNATNIRLDFIVDDSALKQGKYTPGTNTPIVSIDKLNDYTDKDRILFVPLAWNFFTEIKSRIQNVRANKNDKFVKYFPKVTVSQ